MQEMQFHPDAVGLIVNRAPNGELDAGTRAEIENQRLDLLGVVPQDDKYIASTVTDGRW